MAIASSKKFLRTMAQPFEQSTKSLWGLDEVLEQQQRRNGQLAEAEEEAEGGMGMEEEEEDMIVEEVRGRTEEDGEEDLFVGIDDDAFMDLS